MAAKLSCCCSTTLCGDRSAVKQSIARDVVKASFDKMIIGHGEKEQRLLEMHKQLSISETGWCDCVGVLSEMYYSMEAAED